MSLRVRARGRFDQCLTVRLCLCVFCCVCSETAVVATPQASPGGTLSAGMRKAQEKLRFPDHESLLTLLERLLSVKEALASPDIVQYYKDSTGDVDLTALASLHGHRFGGIGGGGGGGAGRRSPVSSMFASSRTGGATGRGDGDVQDTSVDGGASDTSDPAPLLFSPKPRSGAVVGGVTLGGGGGLSLSSSAAAAAAHVASLRSPSPVLPMSSAGMSLEGHGHQPLHHHNVHHAVHLLHHGNRSTILAPRTPTSRPASNASLASTHSQSSSSTSNAGLRRLTTPPLPAPLAVPSLHPAATARPLPAKVAADVATGSLFSPTPGVSGVVDATEELLPPVPTQSTANSRTSSGSDNFDDDIHHSEQ